MGIIKISAMANAKILEGVWDNVVTNHKECWVELHSTNVRPPHLQQNMPEFLHGETCHHSLPIICCASWKVVKVSSLLS